MNKLLAMTIYVQIVDSGSLTAAAEVLGTSLPTVVRKLASLEKALGVRLLNRTTRKITLTDEGRHYLEQCRRILADIENAEHAFTDQQSEPIGKITVTAPVMFGRIHVSPIVTRFMKEFNRVNVELLLLDRNVNLVDEGVDVAIRIGHLGDSSMVARPVGKIRQVVCASPELIIKTGDLKRPEELSHNNCIRVTGLAPGPILHFYENRKQLTIPINDTFVCNQVDAAIEACTAGIGFGVFLCYQVESLVKQGKLVFVLTDFEPPPLPVSVVYSQPKLISTRLRMFVDRITQDLEHIL